MRTLTAISVLLGATLLAEAQTNEIQSRPISLQDCLQGALEKNLDLRIARYTPPLARLDLVAAYAGYNPSFSISGQHSFSLSGGGFNSSIGTNTPPSSSDANSFSSALGGLLPWGLSYNLSGRASETYGSQRGPFDSSSGSASVSLTQPLLKNFWIDQTRLGVRVAKNRLQYSELSLKQTLMSTATSVENAYYDLIAACENVRVQEKAVELAEALVAENKKRVEVGALAPLDEQDAEAQAASSRAALIKARQALGTQLETVKSLISDDFAAWAQVDLVPVDTLGTNFQTFDLQESWTKAMALRPDLLQAKLDVERQGITLKYNFNQLFPQLDLVGSYGHGASGSGIREFSDALDEIREGSRPSYSYGAQLTFPLGNTGARANYKQGKLTMETLMLTLKKLEQSILIQVHNDIGTVRADYESLGATRTARQFAEAALDAEQKKLERGKSTTYTVLQKQRDLTSARASEIQSMTDYNKALSRLSLDQGATLERLRIDVEMKAVTPERR